MSPRRTALIACLSLLAAAVSLPVATSTGNPGTVRVFVVDNAFVRDGQRPVVRINEGSSVAWHWRSRQSHSVQVSSGPARWTGPTRTRGKYTRRFKRAGTYRIVCALHAPGMRMKVVVRRR